MKIGTLIVRKEDQSIIRYNCYVADDIKPVRLYFKTYLQVIRNSVGTNMFRNFYVRLADGQEIDAMSDGSNSCAFYVSGVLTMLKKVNGVHGTVASLLKDLEASGWKSLDESQLQPGDVILWEAMEFEGRQYQHVGFYMGDNRAISTSMIEKKVVEHDMHFGEIQRRIIGAFRAEHWD